MPLLASGNVPNYEMKYDMERVIYATVWTCMSDNTVVWNTSAQSLYVDCGTWYYAAGGILKRLTYLCIVELCLHVQRLQNLIENRLQTERCSFLTLHLHSGEKVFPCKKCEMGRGEIWGIGLQLVHKLRAEDRKTPDP